LVNRSFSDVKLKRWLLVVTALILTAGCGPEPTTPADTNLAGTWTAKNAHLYTLSNFRLEIIQEPKGIVSGMWYARGDGGLAGCFPNVPCDAFGHLIGRNTVSQIELELLGAGKFEGGLVEPGRMRGIFSVGVVYDTITFERATSTSTK
jgi:hypothetical protein